ncbi:MAG: glycosyl hydrolase family 18 protein [Bacillota bacterium]|jgi:spore germination protein YaaH
MPYPPRALRRRPRPMTWPFLVLPILLGIVYWVVFAQSYTYTDKAPASRPYLIYRGDRQVFPVVVEGGEAYVPLSFIKEVLDPNIFWEEEGLVVVTTQDKVIKLGTDSLTAYVNQHPVELRFPVILDGNEPYIPATTLEILYPVATFLWPDAGTFFVKRTDEEATVATALDSAIVREWPSSRARRVGVVEPGASFQIYDTVKDWYRVEVSGGLFGYVLAKDLGELETEGADVPKSKPYEPSPLIGRKVSLVWEPVERYTPDPSSIGDLSGINVVSPTWFRLGAIPGQVENYADRRYVDWAHSKGHQVWALFSNSFDPDRTRTVLRDSLLRDQVIAQMLVYAEVYSLDGINIDFENVYQEDAPYLTQFVREMTPLFHQMGLTVSMDVTVKSLSPTWSLCYERERLADAVDYIMLMAYDQYGGNSKVAGPNAALPWTEWTIKTTLEEVPKEKLVLGIPFYTRLWRETLSDGEVKVTQRALGMKAARDWMAAEKVVPRLDEDSGMEYAQKKSGPDTYRIWLENAESVRKRLELAKTYDLAGVAAWSRVFADSETWRVMEEFLLRD